MLSHLAKQYRQTKRSSFVILGLLLNLASATVSLCVWSRNEGKYIILESQDRDQTKQILSNVAVDIEYGKQSHIPMSSVSIGRIAGLKSATPCPGNVVDILRETEVPRVTFSSVTKYVDGGYASVVGKITRTETHDDRKGREYVNFKLSDPHSEGVVVKCFGTHTKSSSLDLQKYCGHFGLVLGGQVCQWNRTYSLRTKPQMALVVISNATVSQWLGLVPNPPMRYPRVVFTAPFASCTSNIAPLNSVTTVAGLTGVIERDQRNTAAWLRGVCAVTNDLSETVCVTRGKQHCVKFVAPYQRCDVCHELHEVDVKSQEPCEAINSYQCSFMDTDGQTVSGNVSVKCYCKMVSAHGFPEMVGGIDSLFNGEMYDEKMLARVERSLMNGTRGLFLVAGKLREGKCSFFFEVVRGRELSSRLTAPKRALENPEGAAPSAKKQKV